VAPAGGEVGRTIALDESDEARRLLREVLVCWPERLAQQSAELSGNRRMANVCGKAVEEGVGGDDIIISDAFDSLDAWPCARGRCCL
jgi:hypothetical protein